MKIRFLPQFLIESKNFEYPSYIRVDKFYEILTTRTHRSKNENDVLYYFKNDINELCIIQAKEEGRLFEFITDDHEAKRNESN